MYDASSKIKINEHVNPIVEDAEMQNNEQRFERPRKIFKKVSVVTKNSNSIKKSLITSKAFSFTAIYVTFSNTLDLKVVKK